MVFWNSSLENKKCFGTFFLLLLWKYFYIHMIFKIVVCKICVQISFLYSLQSLYFYTSLCLNYKQKFTFYNEWSICPLIKFNSASLIELDSNSWPQVKSEDKYVSIIWLNEFFLRDRWMIFLGSFRMNIVFFFWRKILYIYYLVIFALLF